MNLSEIIAACDKPFEWGTNDCCTLMGIAVQEQQGRDVVSVFLGYSDKAGAARALREHGAGTLLATVEREVGPAISPAQARPLDIVMYDALRVGICCGRYSLFLGEHGVVRLKTLQCMYAFANRKPAGGANG